MLEIKFIDSVVEEECKFAVVFSKFKNKWVLCKHKKRNTYESPRRKERRK